MPFNNQRFIKNTLYLYNNSSFAFLTIGESQRQGRAERLSQGSGFYTSLSL
jgi:hypothetical protein